jgi:2'-5' RNA ligase
MRLFIAVETSDDVRRAARELQLEMKGAAERDHLRATWVAAENMHLTLQFLGEAKEEAIARIEKALKSAAQGVRAFDTIYRGAGAFPNAAKPRVLWAGVADGREPLIELARRAGEALTPLGFPPEERAFSPHLTLARIKDPQPSTRVQRVIDANKERTLGAAHVARVVLFQSVLRPQGAIYTPVGEAPLSVD